MPIEQRQAIVQRMKLSMALQASSSARGSVRVNKTSANANGNGVVKPAPAAAGQRAEPLALSDASARLNGARALHSEPLDAKQTTMMVGGAQTARVQAQQQAPSQRSGQVAPLGGSRFDENASHTEDYFASGSNNENGLVAANSGALAAAQKRNQSLIAARNVAAATLSRAQPMQQSEQTNKKAATTAPAIAVLSNLPSPTQLSSLSSTLTSEVHNSSSTDVGANCSGVLHDDVSSENVHDESEVALVGEGMASVCLDESSVAQSASVAPSTRTSPAHAATSCDDADADNEARARRSLPPPTPAQLADAALSHPAPLSPNSAFPRRSPTARSLPAHCILAAEQADIAAHLEARSRALAVPPNYMDLQPELNWRMREILLDWLGSVATRFRLKPEALMLCASLLDRFLSRHACPRERLQLLGITCLIVAAKYEEMVPPSLEDFLALTDHAFTRAGVLAMEGALLQAVEYNLTVPYVSSFTGTLVLRLRVPERSSAATSMTVARDFESELRNFVLYFTLVATQTHSMLCFAPSLRAAAIVALAYFQLQDDMFPTATPSQVPTWDEELQSASGYTLPQLRECVRELEHALQSLSDVPGSIGASIPGQKYNSVTKRFAKPQLDAVAARPLKCTNIPPA